MMESLLTSWKTDCENQKDPMRFGKHLIMYSHFSFPSYYITIIIQNIM